jgi:glycosyltransferase involved in cell wall biosynthesis
MISTILSVIIPIYNTAPYLRRCLDSVVGQTLRDIEIICVNDGSTDGSVEILREYAAKDSRIILITLPTNRGPALARNRGMAVACGDYLGFVDSDDHPSLDFYEKLHTRAVETCADVAKGNYRYWGMDGKSLPVDYSMNDAVRKHKTNFSFAFCSAIYKKALLTKHDILFPEDLIDIEDPIFSLKTALHCNKITIINDAEINIMLNEHSASYGVPEINRIIAKFEGVSRILDLLNDNNVPEESYGFVNAFWFRSIMDAVLQNKTEEAYKITRDSLGIIFRKFKFQDVCAAAFNNIGIGDLFTALAAEDVGKLSAYLIQFYERKIFALNHLNLLSKIKSEVRPGKATVAIPIYAEQPENLEYASLQQCLNILGKHNIIFFGPEGLDISAYTKIAHERGVNFLYEPFPRIYFASPSTYSKLLLDAVFYSHFCPSEYLLIYQLDCWVFRDELSAWCATGYDYIGAPWFEDYADADDKGGFIEPSGNGGFSLRKIDTFVKSLRALHTSVLAGKLNEYAGMLNCEFEDRIVVELFPKVYSAFSVASINEAMRFSFEVLPERLYALTGKLPFGCHGFAKYSRDFWKQHIALLESNDNIS